MRYIHHLNIFSTYVTMYGPQSNPFGCFGSQAGLTEGIPFSEKSLALYRWPSLAIHSPLMNSRIIFSGPVLHPPRLSITTRRGWSD